VKKVSIALTEKEANDLYETLNWQLERWIGMGRNSKSRQRIVKIQNAIYHALESWIPMNRTCKKSLQVEPINPTVKDLLTVAGLLLYRDMYVALTVCTIPQGDEVVVHGLDGSTEYTITAEQCEFLRQEMKRLLEKQKEEK
jgi:hypothetical protein